MRILKLVSWKTLYPHARQPGADPAETCGDGETLRVAYLQGLKDAFTFKKNNY